MIFLKPFATIYFIFFGNILCDDSANISENLIEVEYMGERFPTKYLTVEDIVPTDTDLNHYINKLKLTVDYFGSAPNDTDANKALGLFYMKALLKRTLADYNTKLDEQLRKELKYIINKGDDVVSHYVYVNTRRDDPEALIAEMFRDDTPQVFSIGEFTKNRLKKWIRSKGQMNEFLEQIDDATLPKEKYLELTEKMDEYDIKIWDSDFCIAKATFNPEPIHLEEITPCKHDPFCLRSIHTSPSIAYTLSHRLVNLLMLRHLRRCYMQSIEDDFLHMEILCAFMYREAVYIARRGYFARDMFLEHVALCSLLGYEEFHRRHWFYKATSWMDEKGCIQEYTNFDLNRTRLYTENYKDNPKRQEELRNHVFSVIKNKCHNHPMALLVVVLANAIRHAVHFVPTAVAEA